MVHTSSRAMATTIYSIFFSNDKEAALAAMSAWNGLGTGMAFAISSHMCNKLYLILMICTASGGTTLYFISEAIYSKHLLIKW